MERVSSFHGTQMVWSFCDRFVASFRPNADRGKIEVRQIRIGTFGSISFPEDFELTTMHGTGQSWRQEAVVVVGIDPDRALRRVVAVICRSALPSAAIFQMFRVPPRLEEK